MLNLKTRRLLQPLRTLFCSTLLALVAAPMLVQAQASQDVQALWTFPAQQISSYSLTIADSGDEADIYYPDLPDEPKATTLGRFPIVLMSQGAMVDKEYYSTLAATVARYGFIVVVPNQRNAQLGEELRYAEMSTIGEVLAQMQQEDLDPNSPVFGTANTNKLALMGHSFGGVSSIFAAANFCGFPFCDLDAGFVRPPELKALVLTSSNSGSFDLDTTGVPVAIIGGSEESGREKQLATYQTLEPPKAFITIEGGNHYGMCDANVPPGALALEGETDQLVPQSITAARYGHWAGLWLRAHVRNDQRAANRIFSAAELSGVTVISQQD